GGRGGGGLAQQDVLEERHARRGRARIRRRRLQRRELLTSLRRPGSSRFRERPEGLLQARRVAALRGETRVVEARRDVLALAKESLEHGLGLGFVFRTPKPLRVLGERKGRFRVGRIEIERALPVADGLLELSLSAPCKREEPLDVAAAGSQLRRLRELLERRLDL